MSRPDGEGTTQSRENVRQPGLRRTTTREGSMPPQARASGDSDDVSSRSPGEFVLDERLMEERKWKIEEAKRKAREGITLNIPSCPSEPVRPAEPSTAATSKSAQSALNSVSPELLTELRKIIRDEFEQLNRGSVKEALGDKTPRPLPGRDRPTSPIQPFGTKPPTNGLSSNNSDDRKTSPTAGAPSPTKGQQRPSPRQSTVRFSDETKPAVTPRADEPRSSPPEDVELTAIDKKWGVLFESSGTHTNRTEHIVRGLANYIIEEFLPQRSIVITPEKMAAFYSHHRLDREKFPFATLFRSKPTSDFHGALSTLYEDLGCQYFLVQAESRSRPTVPSLTPGGFVHWLITMIQAYPDEEARRLDKIVSALPIEADSLLDGKPERLPKQISRYLLPKEALRKTRRLVDETMRGFQEDMESSSAPRSKGSTSSSSSSSNTSTSRPTPIVVTATAEKRPSMTASSSHNSRYVPDVSFKEVRIDEPFVGGYERDRRTSTAASSSRDPRADDMNRRHSMPVPPPPSKPGRPGPVAEGGRTGPGSREAHGASATGASGKAPTGPPSSSSRRHRSPQRNPHSQSVPAGLECHEPAGGDRPRPSAISAAAASVAATVLGAFAHAHAPPNPPGAAAAAAALDGGARDPRGSGEQQHRDRRAGADEPAARAPASAHGARDKADVDGGGTGRSSKRRSVVVPDVRGPTWDDYLRSSAPRSATPSLARRDGGHGSSG